MAAQDVQGMLVRIEATTAQLRAEMKRADAAVGNATKGIDKQLSKVDGAFDRLGVGAGKAASAVRALAPALAGLATLEALRRAQQLGEEFTLLEARIKRLSGGTAEAAVTYSRLAEVARQSGTSLGDTVKLWESLTGTLEELGATDAQVVRLTDTLQKIGTIGGSSAQEVSSALRQLGQGLAGGVIRAEEFNSVIEGMPELGREIARGLGVPFGELRQLMLDGELTAEKVLGAIQRRAFDVDAEFAKLPRTVSQASNALTNDFGRAIAEIDKAIGGSVNLARFLDTLAKGIRFTAGDFTDLERLNQLTAERAKLQQSYEQAERRTLLSAKERATFESGLKRLNTEILEIQNRRVQQMKEEGKAIQSNGPAQNEQYDKYLAKLKESAALQGVNSEVAKVRYAIEKGELGKLTEAQQASLLKYAAEKDAKVAAEKAGLSYAKGLEDQASAIKALTDKYDPAAKAQAEYDAGIKLADESLRNGTYTAEQYQKVVQGLYVDLNKPIWDKHNADADEAAAAIARIDDQLEAVRDRLDPARAATKRLTDEKKLLKEALDKGRVSFEEYTQRVGQLDEEYARNQKSTSEWTQWTESALERVDSAFADAWRNIGDGFSSFRDSLTDAFKQMLAELAHIAITRKIVLQIGAALGIGGGSAGAGLMSLGGGAGGSGGSMLADAWQYGSSLYNTATSGFGQAVMAGWNSGTGLLGGLQGAAAGGWNYGSTALGGMFSGGSTAAGTAAGYGLGQPLVTGTAGSASYAASSGIWGSGVSGTAAGLYGVGGALYGYGQSGWKGAATGALGGVGGGIAGGLAGVAAAEALGLAAGSILGPIGAALGAALGGWIGGSLFGGDWQTKDVGLALSAQDGDFVGQQYEYQKKKGGLFGSNKKRTRYSALDPEFESSLRDTYDATQAGVAELFESLSYSIDEGTLDGLQLAKTQISTKGKTEEEIQQAISEWFGEAAEAMNTELNKVFDTGLDLDLAGMQAFVGNLLSVNDAIRYLNLGLFEASVAGGKMAEELSALAGGFDALAQNTATYYTAFFTAAEQQANALDAVRRQFEGLDVALPATRAEFRRMVEALDLTTATGREMFATMTSLAGSASAAYSALEAQLMGAVQSSFAAVQRSVAAQRKAIADAFSARSASLNDMAATASASLSGMTGVANSLDAALKRLRGSSDDAVRMLRAQAVATLQSALSLSRSGQSLAGVSGLQDALDVASEMDTALYGSLEDFQREQGRTAGLIAELEKVNGKQLTTEEKLLKSVQDQLKTAQQQYDADMAGLDAQLAYAQAQLDALNGIDNSVMGLAGAIAAMGSSVVAALGALPKGAAQANTPQNNRSIIDTIYQSVLGRGTAGDEAGAAFWSNALQTGQLGYDQIAQAIAKGAVGNAAESAATKTSAEQFLKGLGIPGFASGGLFGGGARIVGERGPELEVTGPSRIYSASQTAAMLGGGGAEVVAELRVLRARLDTIEANTRAGAQHASRSTKILERVTQGGDAMQTIGATA